MCGQPGFELGQGFRHIAAAIAETDVPRFVIDGAGKKEHTGLANDLLAEGLDISVRFKTGKADSAAVGRCPGKEVGLARKERRELGEVAQNNL